MMKPIGPSWVLLPPESVPERFHARAIDLKLLALTDDEAADLLGAYQPQTIDPMDEELMHLLARGQTIATIGHRLGLAGRTIDKKVARLREQMGVGSTSELACLLAGKGFGWS